MRDKIFEIISGIAKKNVDEIKSSQDKEKLWDSLLHVELVFALESEFDIFFSAEEIAEINTPEKVLEIVQSKVASSET